MQVGQLAVMFIISFEMPGQKMTVSSFQLTLLYTKVALVDDL